MQALQSQREREHTLPGVANPSVHASDTAMEHSHLETATTPRPNDHCHGVDGVIPPLGHPSNAASVGAASSSSNFQDRLELPSDHLVSIAAQDSSLAQMGNDTITFILDPHNKVGIPVRERVMQLFFSLQKIIFALRTKLAREEGRVEELRVELAEARDNQSS